jgi:formamidopyrimidine-DNA glycosylase
MAEYPDLENYLVVLNREFKDRVIEEIRVASPYFFQYGDFPLETVQGLMIKGFSRLGRYLVWELEHGFRLVFHLMVTGRFHIVEKGINLRRKRDLAAVDFPFGSLLISEVGYHKRATLHLVQGEASLQEFDAGGLNLPDCDFASFNDMLNRSKHTLKRILVDPTCVSGIGHAYSDEMLHAFKLNPTTWAKDLNKDYRLRIFTMAKNLLRDWTECQRRESGKGFPEIVAAFKQDFAVHGRFGDPCPACDTEVERLVFGDHQTNYCPNCQPLDESLSKRKLNRLLKSDWPQTIEAMERGLHMVDNEDQTLGG